LENVSTFFSVKSKKKQKFYLKKEKKPKKTGKQIYIIVQDKNILWGKIWPSMNKQINDANYD